MLMSCLSESFDQSEGAIKGRHAATGPVVV
jgi:hypothetical protein